MQFHEAKIKLRTLREQEDHLSLLQESEVHSTTYGINNASILQQLDNFDITICLPFDIMHTKGVAVLYLNLLLLYMIDTQNWITLIQLNNIIQSHGYGYTESDTKPNHINRGQTIDADFHIKSSGTHYCVFSV